MTIRRLCIAFCLASGCGQPTPAPPPLPSVLNTSTQLEAIVPDVLLADERLSLVRSAMQESYRAVLRLKVDDSVRDATTANATVHFEALANVTWSIENGQLVFTLSAPTEDDDGYLESGLQMIDSEGNPYEDPDQFLHQLRTDIESVFVAGGAQVITTDGQTHGESFFDFVFGQWPFESRLVAVNDVTDGPTGQCTVLLESDRYDVTLTPAGENSWKLAEYREAPR